ncbi:MAG TPA: phosphate signaling complex protein PhoU [Gemmatimonadaceae bacterium]|nr:phosphate signaling complex protein PhoU [Gemmatimonadaceae bacterium]
MSPSDQGSGFRHFHEQLAQLRQKLLEMSGHAEQLVDQSITALIERDRLLADSVIAGDKVVNSLEIEIEQLAISLLALQQPMARDLRSIVGTIKVSGDLERVGDHAVNIAEAAIRLVDEGGSIVPSPELDDMSRRARAMLRQAIDAFTRADGVLGREVCKADDAVDALHNSVFRILLTHMMEDARTITPSLELLLVSRNLERVADLATNIGEDAVYLAEGKQIKHHFED